MRTPRSYALNGENLAAGLLDGHVHIVKADSGVMLRDMDFGHDIVSLSYEPSGERSNGQPVVVQLLRWRVLPC